MWITSLHFAFRLLQVPFPFCFSFLFYAGSSLNYQAVKVKFKILLSAIGLYRSDPKLLLSWHSRTHLANVAKESQEADHVEVPVVSLSTGKELRLGCFGQAHTAQDKRGVK